MGRPEGEYGNDPVVDSFEGLLFGLWLSCVERFGFSVSGGFSCVRIPSEPISSPVWNIFASEKESSGQLSFDP